MGENYTSVVTSQEHGRDFCYDSIAESRLTEKDDPVRKGSSAHSILFLEIYRVCYRTEGHEMS